MISSTNAPLLLYSFVLILSRPICFPKIRKDEKHQMQEKRAKALKLFCLKHSLLQGRHNVSMLGDACSVPFSPHIFIFPCDLQQFLCRFIIIQILNSGSRILRSTRLLWPLHTLCLVQTCADAYLNVCSRLTY